MQVVIHHQQNFLKSLASIRAQGGLKARVATQVDTIIVRAQTGEGAAELRRGLTKHGESRIQHCYKFDLADAHRLVTLMHEDVLWLLFVGTHDETDRWLDQNRGLKPVVDTKSKRLTLVFSAEPGAPIPLVPPKPIVAPEERLLDKLDDDSLDLLAPPPATMRRLTALTVVASDDELQEAATKFPAADRELALTVLLALRDRTPENATAAIRLARGDAQDAAEASSLVHEALGASINADAVINLRDLSPEEIEQLLKQPDFEAWMLFLHPDQRTVADATTEGATYLRGVSGSGKTSVLVHRANTLAERYPEDRILVVALNPALAVLINQLLDAVCPPARRMRIDCLSIGELCRSVLRQYEPARKIQQYDPRNDESLEDNWVESYGRTEQQVDLAPIIQSLSGTHQTDASRYLRDEFIWIRSAFSAPNDPSTLSQMLCRDQYVDPERAPRRGRAIAFSRDWRERTLRGLSRYEEWLSTGAFVDAAALVLAAHRHRDGLQLEPPNELSYRCILVDEVQDLGTVELDLIRALVQKDTDGLFLVGDLRQQVFPKDHDLRAAGLGGLRRRYFRRNYRNTRQILEAAVALSEALGTSSGEEGELEQLEPEYSAREGPKPLAVVLSNDQREFEWIVGYIRLKRRDDQLPVCIAVCGLREDDDDELRELTRHYQRLGIEVTPLLTDSKLRPGAIFLSALETIKGFEFSLVIVSRNRPAKGVWPSVIARM